MKKVTANQPFYGSRTEQQWNISDTREVSDERAAELLKAGLVDEPEAHAEQLAAQNKVLDDAANKATADKLKSLSDTAKTAQKNADLDKARREKEVADRAQAEQEAADKAAADAQAQLEKEAKEAAERLTKEEKDKLSTKDAK